MRPKQVNAHIHAAFFINSLEGLVTPLTRSVCDNVGIHIYHLKVHEAVHTGKYLNLCEVCWKV
jgi:hypothetical protein